MLEFRRCEATSTRGNSQECYTAGSKLLILYLSPMRLLFLLMWALCCLSCHRYHRLSTPEPAAGAPSGAAFYTQVSSLKWNDREPIALREILSGNIPAFLKKMVPVEVTASDSAGKTIRATFYVTPDYLSIGRNDDWARIPLTPMAAQQIADSFQCFLPTRKMVDDIYRQATVKLEPVPLYSFRDSAIIFWHHHLIIEGQRKNRGGLIAGIKKDVVLSGKVSRDTKSNRVAIYGWHTTDGKPIQPLYTGHVDWYVDYSHGIRLVYRKIKVNGRWMDYTDVLKHPVLSALICDEPYCDFFRY